MAHDHPGRPERRTARPGQRSGRPAHHGEDRRRALRVLAGATGCLAVLGPSGLVGCGGAETEGPDRTPIRVPLARLAGGARVRVTWAGLPVEIHRDGERIVARSLLCTHMGCTVRWIENEHLYRCPCHQGVYDADGRAIEGPPPRPLRAVPARVEGDTLVVGGPEGGAGG
jgi:Rieske Fe-S protein